MKYKYKKQQKKELGCVFIRINPDQQNFNVFKAINEIDRHIKISTIKYLIDKFSKRILELEFNSNHLVITKAFKRVVRKVLPSL